MSQLKYSNKRLQREIGPDAAHMAPDVKKTFGFWTHQSRITRILPGKTIPALSGVQAPSQSLHKSNPSGLLWWYMALDAMALMFAFLASWWLAGFVDSVLFHRVHFDPKVNDEMLRIIQYIVIVCCVLLNFERTGHYKLRMPFWLETQNIIATLGIAMIIDGFLQFASKQDFSRVTLVLSWALAALMIIGSHAAFRVIMWRLNRWQIRALLIGTGATAEDAP